MEASIEAMPIEHVFKQSLKSQYHAALAMLREAVEQCPDDMWLNEGHVNAFWQVAYHSLYFTHLYLQPNQEAFQPWREHQSDVQHPDGYAGPADPNSALPLIPKPYSRAQVLDYWAECDAMVDACIENLSLTASADGFPWKRKVVRTAEFQIGNLRHLQHGASLLAARLRADAGIGIEWVGSGPDATRSAG